MEFFLDGLDFSELYILIWKPIASVKIYLEHLNNRTKINVFFFVENLIDIQSWKAATSWARGLYRSHLENFQVKFSRFEQKFIFYTT